MLEHTECLNNNLSVSNRIQEDLEICQHISINPSFYSALQSYLNYIVY